MPTFIMSGHISCEVSPNTCDKKVNSKVKWHDDDETHFKHSSSPPEEADSVIQGQKNTGFSLSLVISPILF